MLAGCHSLLSPRHRISSEGSSQFQVSHYPLGSMSGTQRLDLPRSLSHKEVVPRPQSSSRAVNLSVEIPNEGKKSWSMRPNVGIPSPLTAATQQAIWEERGRKLKRFPDHSWWEESRAKRKRSNGGAEELGCGDLWLTGGLDEQRKAVSLPSIPWIESKGDKDVYSTDEEGGIKENWSPSASSSETHGSPTKFKGKQPLAAEEGNGSHSPRPSHGLGIVAAPPTYSGVELLNLLVSYVESISSKNLSGINHYLSRLGQLASPDGPTAIHRVIAYFTEALTIRIARMWSHIFHISVPREKEGGDDDTATLLRLLNQISPIPKFLHFTANEMLLRSFEGKDKIHIIDFDIQQGLQWTGLFQSLAMRPKPPAHVRITGIGESKQELEDTGDRLAGFAQALNLRFEYHPVVDKLEDVRLWMLHVKDGECVAVNCILQLHKLLYSRASLSAFLGLIRSASPDVVVMGEQEAEHNDGTWELRFSTCFKYYSAIYDSIDTALPSHSSARIKIEEMFGREIRNIIASEGDERIERHQTFKKWKTIMEDAGFKCSGLGGKEVLQSQMLLKMYSCQNFSIEEQNQSEGLTLNYLDQPLYTVSSWQPLEHQTRPSPT